jgi:hypothetical protein
MGRRAGGVVLVGLLGTFAACSSGTSKGAGERFVAAPTSTTSTTSIAQALNGSYDIDIQQVVSGASTCRTRGTFHEQVAVDDSVGTRRVTFTNTVPAAGGGTESEAGVLQSDGSFQATGAFKNGTYTWQGTFPGDGTVSGTFTGTTPAATCSWRVSGRRV